MKFENINTLPDLIKRKKTGIFEDGFRNNLLRDSEGDTFYGFKVYHLIVNETKHQVLYFDDLVESLGLPDGQKPRFKTLFISINFRELFILRRDGPLKGYCRATKMKSYSRNYLNFYTSIINRQHLPKTFTDEVKQLAGVNFNPYPVYVSEVLSRTRLNFGCMNYPVLTFLNRFLIPIAKLFDAFIKSTPNAILSEDRPHMLNFEENDTNPIVESNPVNTKRWVIACDSSDGMNFIDTKIWYSEQDCRKEIAKLVLTTGQPHVKLLVEERAEISTSIVWS